MYSGEASPSYYSVLGVGTDASDEEIRRAYRKLAMQWHPDKWTRIPSLLAEAKQKFQLIQEAYSVLSDRSKRVLYDAGMYSPEDEEDEVEGFSDFVGEMVSLMNDAREEVPEWDHLVQGQSTSDFQWLCGQSSLYNPGKATTASWETSTMQQGNSQSSLGTLGTHHLCT